MRKITLLLTLVLLSLFPAMVGAQTHYKANIAVGGHAGADLSRVAFTPSVTQGFQPGFNVGLNFRYIEEKHFGFIVEANFDQRGWKESFEDDEPFEYSRTVNYVTIPFLAHIYFGNRGRFFINAGPSISFTLGESTSANFDYKNLSSVSGFPLRTTYQYDESVNQKVDYGISAGLGGEFSINKRNAIYLDGRFYYGLGNMLKSGRTENIRGSNSMTISVSVGYWFRVDK
jgi:hypothetical protein